ncbi:serine hydrolase domain-containing protein [Flagellimonas meridianipacifica]|uniref:CubicO group peptidase (Beta-lactamase class C family) n=1 Tax=Flagellimonas meridianipacifica TaxID=1080225 RepID=A0A2T0MHE1_9FLAO|nr:serine hydrolase domain-containing protein [Allomuricauda pacifica]PRX56956.1 CubicO group peptidase (beta-lactamase class C family) [Allomuricauda pacifica]
MSKSPLFISAFLISSGLLFCQSNPSQSAAVKRQFHERFNLTSQFEGGDLSRYVYTHMSEFFPNITLQKSENSQPLPLALNKDIDSFQVSLKEQKVSLANYVHQAPVDGMLMIHKGKIVFEVYPRMHPDQKHLYMSVTKPFAGALVAILEDKGLIDVSETIETYIPELKNTAWEDIRIINILDMASGICWEFEEGMETYNNLNSCYMQFEGSIGWSPSIETTPANPYEGLAKMERYKEQGLSNDYSGINTFLLSWLIEKVTGQRYTDVLEAEIWQPMGTENDGLMVTPKRNISAAFGGMSSTLRDLGRFGLLFTPSGPQGIISEAHLEKIQKGGRPKLLEASESIPLIFSMDDEKPAFCTYQWDFTMADGDFYKSGFHGQGLYVSPEKDLVIAYFGTSDRDGTYHDLRNISRQLAKSTLFGE